MYEYAARLIRDSDGDTVYLKLDLGFGIEVTLDFRLALIDAPPLRTPEGQAAKQWLVAKLDGQPLIVRSLKNDTPIKHEKWRRWLALIFVGDEQMSVNQQMIDAGYAKSYSGGQHET